MLLDLTLGLLALVALLIVAPLGLALILIDAARKAIIEGIRIAAHLASRRKR